MFHLDSFRVYNQKPLLGAVAENTFSPDWKPINISVNSVAALKIGLTDKNGIDICEGDILRGNFEPANNQKGRFVVRFQPNESRFVVRFEWGKNFVDPGHNSLRVCDMNFWIARNCSVISNVIIMDIRKERTQALVIGVKFFTTGFQITQTDAINFLDYIHEHIPLNWDEHIKEVKAKLQLGGTLKLFVKINDRPFIKLDYEPMWTTLLKPDEKLYLGDI